MNPSEIESKKAPRKKHQGLFISSFILKLAKKNEVSIRGETLDIIHQLLVGFLENLAATMNLIVSDHLSKKTLKISQLKVAAEITFGIKSAAFSKRLFEFIDETLEQEESPSYSLHLE